MSESKNTPGPWRTFERPMSIEILCGDRLAPAFMPSAGIRVADVRFKRVGRGGRFVMSAADEANARLIAAAPDLFNAIVNSDNAHWTPAMRAALAKATGATS